MLGSPLVSVCVQTYQHQSYIEDCIKSILAQQTSFKFELLIGEDCSTDGTRDIVLDYQSRYPDLIRIFLHDRSNVIYVNGSPTGRYNFLHNLRNAIGKYIAVCEGDDYWTDPLKLQKQVDFLEKNDEYAICYHRCELSNKSFKIDQQPTNDFTFSFWQSLQKKNGYTLSMVFRAEAIKDFDLDFYLKDLFNGDWPLECLLTLNHKGYYMGEIMGYYRIHESGISRQLTLDRFIQTRMLFMYRVKKVASPLYHSYINACLGRLYILQLKQYLKMRDILGFFRAFPGILLKQFKLKPWYKNDQFKWAGKFKFL